MRDTISSRAARAILLPPTFTGIAALLDAIVVAGFVQHSLALFVSVVGLWMPLGLIFGVTWATGELISMMPWRKEVPARVHSRIA